MAEIVRCYQERVIFPNGKQAEFIEKVAQETQYSNKELARIVGVHSRTLRDWRRGKFSISYPALKKLCQISGLPQPLNIKIEQPFWYAMKGARLGAQRAKEKYGQYPIFLCQDDYRRKQWHKWWRTKGKFLPNNHHIGLRKKILRPRKSRLLAEFLGIVMGDGGLTDYQLTITLHATDDREYSQFVIRLIYSLFGLNPSIRKRESVINIVISRKDLVELCGENGLKVGNKIRQKIDMPIWIKNNLNHRIACLRGLVDTDGCVFNHRYRIKGKSYSYKKLSFTSMSEPLLSSVQETLKQLDFHPRLTARREVRLDSQKDMTRYFSIIGSHNPKHLTRYREKAIIN